MAGKRDVSFPAFHLVVSNFIISQPMSTGLASLLPSLWDLHTSGVWRGAFS